MRKSIVTLFILLSAWGVKGQPLKLATVFADNMVLQQNEKVPIWGWSHPGEEITLISSWGDTAIVRAQNSAKWRAELQTPGASYLAHTITISGNSKAKTIFLKNILIGEVWLASGQSNMEWTN
ncbi:MAG: sialate O-acetylesterase, partial [Bacteroidetes bacterium]|nr:sialate O-acetylesterase [Bacteroidota bacterium]